MKTQVSFLIGLFFSGILNCPLAQGDEYSEPLESLSALVVSNSYSDDPVIVQEESDETRLKFEISSTYTSKLMWHGIDLSDDESVFYLSGKISFGDSGFSAKYTELIPHSAGKVDLCERVYTGFYDDTLLEESPWETAYTINYFYYETPEVSDQKSDAHEVGLHLFWPNLLSLGERAFTPSYYLGYLWNVKNSHSSSHKGCKGYIHVFGLDHDLKVPGFPLGDKQQVITLFSELTYNDGFAGRGIKHDWSHAVLGARMNIEKGNLTITPSVNYQQSFEDTVNPENELWTTLGITYKF